MKPKPPLEKSIEAKFVRRAEALGCRTLKLNVIGRRSWPDRLVLMPNGRMALFEFKRPGGRLSPGQAALHEELRAMRHEVHLHDSADEALAVLAELMWGEAYLARPKRRRPKNEDQAGNG